MRRLLLTVLVLCACPPVVIELPLDAGTGMPVDAGASTADGGATRTDAGTLASGAPRVLYTDLLSGPTTGGEGGKGIYLSIFGINFGAGGLGTMTKVFINDVEPAVYRSLGPSRGRKDIQQITIQLGALGTPTPGTPLPIRVQVNGVNSNTDQTFTVNPGRVLFVDNVAGNDGTAVIGDIAHPYRFVQTSDVNTGGAWPQVKPGDIIVMRGNGTPWTDIGFENYFMRYRNKSGTAPTGSANSGPIVLMGYPGEDVFIRGTNANGMVGGCVSAINGQTYPTAGDWAVITNLRMDCEGYDGPISQEIGGDHWRVINNDLAASTAHTSGTNVPKMAGITGNGFESVWYGNHIHDIQGSAQECHGIYIDGEGSYDIAYNDIHDIRSGNGFQVYVNGGNGSDFCDDVSFHHNWVHDVSKHGVNVADGSRNGFKIFNNIVFNAYAAGIRFNTQDLVGAKIFNNTFYNLVLSQASQHGAVMNDSTLTAASMELKNNIFWPHTGQHYNGGANGIDATSGTIAKNLWYGGVDTPDFDAAPLAGDPKFVTPGVDFHLSLGTNPAVDTGSSTVSGVVTNDYDITTSRPQGAGYDVGAYERK